VDLFILYGNRSLFLDIIMPLVIHLFIIESFMCIILKGNAMLK